jgi:hypothetical protein
MITQSAIALLVSLPAWLTRSGDAVDLHAGVAERVQSLVATGRGRVPTWIVPETILQLEQMPDMAACQHVRRVVCEGPAPSSPMSANWLLAIREACPRADLWTWTGEGWQLRKWRGEVPVIEYRPVVENMSGILMDLGIAELAAKQLIDRPRTDRRDEELATTQAAWTQMSVAAQVLGIDDLGEAAEEMAARCQRALYPTPGDDTP